MNTSINYSGTICYPWKIMKIHVINNKYIYIFSKMKDFHMGERLKCERKIILLLEDKVEEYKFMISR